jgi:hypothetical protein
MDGPGTMPGRMVLLTSGIVDERRRSSRAIPQYNRRQSEWNLGSGGRRSPDTLLGPETSGLSRPTAPRPPLCGRPARARTLNS